MADELNIATHRWYEPRNNIALAPNDYSKQWIYNSGIQKIDAWISSQPWGGTPLELFAAWPWFLKSGVWSSLGQWVDDVAWTPSWFLTTGAISVYGAYSDSEAWA